MIAYTQPYEDERYNPEAPRGAMSWSVKTPSDAAATTRRWGEQMLVAAFGGALPPVMSDGVPRQYRPDRQRRIVPVGRFNLAKPGQDPATRPPRRSMFRCYSFDTACVGAPAELEARLTS